MATAEAAGLSPALSVVVPARNEAPRLEATLRALVDGVKDGDRTEFVFVLDATSEDDTVAVGTRLAQTESALRLVIVDSKGKGNAVAVGVQAARGDVILLADADLAVDPAQFGSLLGPASAGALAIASRSVRGSRRMGEPLSRFVAGRLFNFAVRGLILPGVRDTQCGFKAFPRSLAAVFGRLETQGWCFDVELIAHARRAGLDVVEVPVVWQYGHGSKLSVTGDVGQIVRELVRLRRRLGRVDA